MKIIAAKDSLFRTAAEHEPWFPTPTPGPYDTDADWQRQHLWDHFTETGNTFGPYRGPTILHHPDLQYALDNGWRVFGGPKMLDHQSRGETGSGNPYLYKIGKDGIIHEAGLNAGPEDMSPHDDESDRQFESMYGSVPESNWRHLISQEGGFAENPDAAHDSLRDVVDDEKWRTAQGPAEGYKDFKLLPGYRNDVDPDGANWSKKHMFTIRRAWDTGTNDNNKHYEDPMPDPYADIDKIPRNQKPVMADDEGPGEFGASRHPRYGATDDPNRELRRG